MPITKQMVSVSLIDTTWLEGRIDFADEVGLTLREVYRAEDPKQGKSGEIRVGTRVFIPWTSILFVVHEP